ncbi:MAG: DUF898 family protein, partial [Oligoflexia bacterium]|nr:DUF898 family protein [Oligoflexia bacterium]
MSNLELSQTKQTRFHLSLDMHPLEMLYLILENIGLTILTLGLYYPWAYAKKSRYLWNCIRLNGSAFSYHGTGYELFVGYLKVFIFYICFSLVVQATTHFISPQAAIIPTVAVILLFIFYLLPAIIKGAITFRLRRSSWLSNHFDFKVANSNWFWTWAKGIVLMPLTLYLYYPAFEFHFTRLTINGLRYKNEQLYFQASLRDFYRMFFKNILFTLLTCGLYLPWATVNKQQFIWAHTSLREIKFNYTMTGYQSLKIHLLYLFALPISLGLAYPWVLKYGLENKLKAIHLNGEIDLFAIAQENSSTTTNGASSEKSTTPSIFEAASRLSDTN